MSAGADHRPITAAGPVWRPYAAMKSAPTPPVVVETNGVRLKLADGRELIDGVSSWWTACHGYNHPVIRAAVAQQLARMPHVMFGGLTHEPAETLAARLAMMTPGDLNHVFFSDSGSVAVEVALKIALQYWLNKGVTGRHKFVAFRGGYHGDTLGAMAVTDPEDGMHARLGAYVPRNILADLPSSPEKIAELDALFQTHQATIAGVIVEPMVQGAGGMLFHAAETLKTLAQLCKKHGLLLIADEIMTGFGRTGSLFAVEQAWIVPDILCLSKALTGGTLSLAATIARTSVFEAFWSDDPAHALMHGPTFMANPLACAAANASLSLFADGSAVNQAKGIEYWFGDVLGPCRGLPGVVDVRSLGAIGVIEFDHPLDTAWLRARAIERGVWLRPFGRILYATPPLTITDPDIDHLTATMVALATDYAAMRHAERASPSVGDL